MSLEKKINIDSASDVRFTALEILNNDLKVKDAYMKKYDLTNEEYNEYVSYAADIALEEGATFTIEYFENALRNRQRLIKLFGLTGKG
ncbi:MAG: hypothetical protein JW791_03255 [Nanoarchaeota archaeon]|nr:hypothetical protein [Nanoarchaeota archaeon]